MKSLAAGLALASSLAAASVPSLPAVEVRTQTGGLQRLAEWRGERVVVAFWATWCGVCREELDALQAAASRRGARLKVLAVAIDSMGWRTVLPFLRERKLSLPVTLLTPSLSRAFMLPPVPPSLPLTLVFNSSGKLAARFQGRLPLEKLQGGF